MIQLISTKHSRMISRLSGILTIFVLRVAVSPKHRQYVNKTFRKNQVFFEQSTIILIFSKLILKTLKAFVQYDRRLSLIYKKRISLWLFRPKRNALLFCVLTYGILCLSVISVVENSLCFLFGAGECSHRYNHYLWRYAQF